MLMYTLIGLCLVLTGIAGLQFTYMFWVERLYIERRKHSRQLEHQCSDLTKRLETAERRVAKQSDLLKTIHPNFGPDFGKEDEAWADVIEER